VTTERTADRIGRRIGSGRKEQGRRNGKERAKGFKREGRMRMIFGGADTESMEIEGAMRGSQSPTNVLRYGFSMIEGDTGLTHLW